MMACGPDLKTFAVVNHGRTRMDRRYSIDCVVGGRYVYQFAFWYPTEKSARDAARVVLGPAAFLLEKTYRLEDIL